MRNCHVLVFVACHVVMQSVYLMFLVAAMFFFMSLFYSYVFLM